MAQSGNLGSASAIPELEARPELIAQKLECDIPACMQSIRPGEFVHRKSLIGFRAAVEAMWGAAGVEVTRLALPDDVRERSAGLLPLPEWIPLEDLVAWHVAVWEGPAAKDRDVMLRHARLTVDQGFGRVKRVVVRALSPHGLASRVATMWRDEYSSGRLNARAVDANAVELELSNHGYVNNPLMRLIIVEVYRYVLSMTGVRSLVESHAVEGSSLLIKLTWE